MITFIYIDGTWEYRKTNPNEIEEGKRKEKKNKSGNHTAHTHTHKFDCL